MATAMKTSLTCRLLCRKLDAKQGLSTRSFASLSETLQAGKSSRQLQTDKNIVSVPRSKHQSLSTATMSHQDNLYSDSHTNDLLSTFKITHNRRKKDVPLALAQEFHLTPSMASSVMKEIEQFDKILLLVRDGEGEHDAFKREWKKDGRESGKATLDEDYPMDPPLTKRGVGQILNVARTTASCCNYETSLIPELVVVSPLKRSIMTGLLSFPQLSPASVRGATWVAHPDCTEWSHGDPADVTSSIQELSQCFPGIDYSLLENLQTPAAMVGAESEDDLLSRADDFLRWLAQRPEKVITVSSHAKWLQTFCSTSMELFSPLPHNSDNFNAGEIRALVVKFQE